MKKMLIVLLVVGLAITIGGYALAGGGNVSEEFEANADTYQHSYSAAGNEAAQSEAGGEAFSKNKGGVTWSGWGAGGVTGEANAQDDSNANTFIMDTGLTSMSGAYAENQGSADGEGASGGVGFAWFDSYNKTFVKVEGFVFQQNTAGETGYPTGTGGMGYNTSSAEFKGLAWDKDCCSSPFLNLSDSQEEVFGWAKTGGFTLINVDPYGQNQSSFGFTSNFAATGVYSADKQWTQVQGSGWLSNGAVSYDTGSSAAGFSNGSFEYTGSNFGSGFVKNSTSAYTNGSSASVHSSGSAGAVSH